MAKINPADIVASVQKLYAKDKRSQSIVSTGDKVKAEYTVDDVVPAPAGHPLIELTGLPGIPYNKLIEVAGEPDTGKSTFGDTLLAHAQKQGVQCIKWDSEDKFDANRFKEEYGGDPDSLFLIKTNETLRGGEMVRKFVTAIKTADATAKILINWDSVGGSQSRSHAERELDDEKHAQPGQDAKENAQVMKMIVALMNKYPDSIAVYMANQVYAKIGFMQKGNASSGGKKVEFFSSLRIQLKRVKVLTKTVNKVKVKYGIINKATVLKNHLSQGKNSVYEMQFTITAAGYQPCDEDLSDDEDSE